MGVKNGLIAKLQDRVHDLVIPVDKAREAAVSQEQRLAEAQRRHQADLYAGAAREAELDEELMDLDCNVHWVTEVWGEEILQLKDEMEVALAANNRAQAKVEEVNSQMQKLENDAVAERNRHDAAEVVLGEELARLQLTADAAAKRCLGEQERLKTERAVAASERDGARVGLASCAVHVQEVHSRSVDLFLAVSEAAYAGEDPVPNTNQEGATSAVRGEHEYALQEVSERTRKRSRAVVRSAAAASSGTTLATMSGTIKVPFWAVL